MYSSTPLCKVPFSTNDDLTSQSSYLIVPSDQFNNTHVLNFCIKSAKLIVQSIITDKVYTLVESFNATFSIAKDLKIHTQKDRIH